MRRNAGVDAGGPAAGTAALRLRPAAARVQAIDQLRRRAHLLQDLFLEAGALGLERLRLAEHGAGAVLLTALQLPRCMRLVAVASAFISEIPENVREEVRLPGSRYTPAPSWRDRPMQPRSAPTKSTSTGSVLSFFKDAPVRFDPSAIRAAKQAEAPRAELKRGVRVRHEQFGDGTILTMEGSGPDAKLTIYFDRAGSKKFIAKFAKLTRI